jgi:2-methylcitrate dehydratase PrpD
VVVETTNGRHLDGRVDAPKGDPDNTLSRSELEAKAIALGRYGGGATEAEMRGLIGCAWGLREIGRIGRLLPLP